MPKPITVRCTVDSCNYWASGNYCDANQILVTSDSMADKQPDAIDANMAGKLSATSVQNCMETCCKSFVPSGAPAAQKKADSILRQ